MTSRRQVSQSDIGGASRRPLSRAGTERDSPVTMSVVGRPQFAQPGASSSDDSSVWVRTTDHETGGRRRLMGAAPVRCAGEGEGSTDTTRRSTSPESCPGRGRGHPETGADNGHTGAVSGAGCSTTVSLSYSAAANPRWGRDPAVGVSIRPLLNTSNQIL